MMGKKGCCWDEWVGWFFRRWSLIRATIKKRKRKRITADNKDEIIIRVGNAFLEIDDDSAIDEAMAGDDVENDSVTEDLSSVRTLSGNNDDDDVRHGREEDKERRGIDENESVSWDFNNDHESAKVRKVKVVVEEEVDVDEVNDDSENNERYDVDDSDTIADNEIVVDNKVVCDEVDEGNVGLALIDEDMNKKCLFELTALVFKWPSHNQWF